MTLAVPENMSIESHIESSPPPTLRVIEEAEAEGELDPQLGESSELTRARSVATSHPDSSIASARLSQALLVQGLSDEALATAKRAVAIAPSQGDAGALVVAGWVLLALHQHHMAETAFGKGTTRTSQFFFAICAVFRGDHEKALARLKGLDTYEALSLSGWLRLQRGDYQGAIQSFRRALEYGVATPDLMTNMAYSQAAMGSHGKALKSGLVATALAPSDQVASINLAAVRTAMRDYKGALAELKRIEARRPDDLRIPMVAALTKWQMGDHKGWRTGLRSLKNDKRFWRATTAERAEVSARLALMDMTEGTLTRTDAKRSIWKSLEASGFQNLLIAQMLVNLHDRGRDLERARELYERLLQFHSRERLYFAEAQVAFLELNFEKALAAVEKWVRIDPFNSGAGTSLTYLLTEVTNDFDRAIQVGEAYLRRLDDRDVLLNNVAYAMVLSGRFDEADKLLERGFDAPHVAATRGLLRIRRGEIDSGVASYDHAIKLAEQLHDEQLARLVRANKLAALDDLGPDSDELANDPDLKDDPRYQLLRHGLLGPSSV